MHVMKSMKKLETRYSGNAQSSESHSTARSTCFLTMQRRKLCGISQDGRVYSVLWRPAARLHRVFPGHDVVHRRHAVVQHRIAVVRQYAVFFKLEVEEPGPCRRDRASSGINLGQFGRRQAVAPACAAEYAVAYSWKNACVYLRCSCADESKRFKRLPAVDL